METVGENLLFQPGVENPRACIQIAIVDDQILEPVECFSVTASARKGDSRLVTINPDDTMVCIVDNGKPNALAVSCAS